MLTTHKLCTSTSPIDTQTSVSALNDCLTDILSGMESSELKLYVDKTDQIIIGTKQWNKIVYYFPVKLLGNDTSPSDTVQNFFTVISAFTSTFHKYTNHVFVTSNPGWFFVINC